MGCVTRILVLRGTTAEREAFTPLNGELVWDTDTFDMYVGDGMTQGGIPLSRLTQEQIEDIIAGLIGTSETIEVVYDDANNTLSLEVITSALVHQELDGAGTNDHAAIDAHISNTNNPHVVTITQAITADSGTDITVAELEQLTDGSDASSLHNHDTQYYTKSEIDAQQNNQDLNIAQNAADIAQEITDRTNADNALQAQITSNDGDIAQNAADIAQEIVDRTNADSALQAQITSNDGDISAIQAEQITQNNDIAQNASDLNDHIIDTNNPHQTTFTQAVAADPGTDITPAEAEQLTDGSEASTLHNHDNLYRKEYWQGSQTADQTNIINNEKPLELDQNKNSNGTVFVWATSELTINKAGDFKFTINVAGDTETGARETLQTKLQRDTGSGFQDIPETEGHVQGFSYHRNPASGEDTNKIDTIITVVSGHKFRVVMVCPTAPAAPPTANGVKTIFAGTGMIVEEK